MNPWQLAFAVMCGGKIMSFRENWRDACEAADKINGSVRIGERRGNVFKERHVVGVSG